MKLLIGVLLSTAVIILVSCVSEEGARKHAERGSAAATKVGMMSGMMWKAEVYSTDAKMSDELGYFESRDECHQATQKHTTHKQAKIKDIATACVMVKSAN